MGSKQTNDLSTIGAFPRLAFQAFFSGSSVVAVAKLLRFPNLFTALADSWAGYFSAQGNLWLIDPIELMLLSCASAGLYAWGVVFNDVVDLPQDRLFRPERPLPSGALSLGVAKGAGGTCLLVGLGAVIALAAMGKSFQPLLLGLLLAACVVLYNLWVKPTALGPAAMGLCRALNFLLGISVGWADQEVSLLFHLWGAVSLATYVAGITLFARREETESRRRDLLFAAAVMGAGFLLLALVPYSLPQTGPFVRPQWAQWGVLLVVIAVILGYRLALAVVDPSPTMVRKAVKQAILWIIVWDATLCFAYAGGTAAGIIVLLLVPAGLLGIWIRLT